MPGPSLVVGLGNPGPEYEHTRHNLGFLVVDVLAERLGARIKPQKGMRALVAEARDGDARIILAKPTTFMNASGAAVAELARYFKIAPADVVVVHDELDLPVAALKVKQGGGDAGHNGLKDITKALGTNGYARVRIGIGRPLAMIDSATYVLQPFDPPEEERLPAVLDRAADSIACLVRDGIQSAMAEFNRPS